MLKLASQAMKDKPLLVQYINIKWSFYEYH